MMPDHWFLDISFQQIRPLKHPVTQPFLEFYLMIPELHHLNSGITRHVISFQIPHITESPKLSCEGN